MRAILLGAASAYTIEQRQAWLGEEPPPRWNRDRLSTRSFVGERGGAVVGFADVGTDGYVDRLFAHLPRPAKGWAQPYSARRR